MVKGSPLRLGGGQQAHLHPVGCYRLRSPDWHATVFGAVRGDPTDLTRPDGDHCGTCVCDVGRFGGSRGLTRGERQQRSISSAVRSMRINTGAGPNERMGGFGAGMIGVNLCWRWWTCAQPRLSIIYGFFGRARPNGLERKIS